MPVTLIHTEVPCMEILQNLPMATGAAGESDVLVQWNHISMTGNSLLGRQVGAPRENPVPGLLLAAQRGAKVLELQAFCSDDVTGICRQMGLPW